VAVLREANAHAWTEIWVDGKGWSIVDATPADDRGDNAPTWLENWTDMVVSLADNVLIWARENILVVLAGGAFLAVAGYVASRRRRLGKLGLWSFRHQDSADMSRRAVQEAYNRAAKRLARRFRPRAAWETPDEWLASALGTLELADPEPLQKLTQLYVASLYRPHAMTAEDADAARQALSRLDRKALKVLSAKSAEPSAT
jgi:hypothetical protein